MQAEALELAGQMAAASLELHDLIAASESEQEAQLPLMEHAEASLACAVLLCAYAHGPAQARLAALAHMHTSC